MSAMLAAAVGGPARDAGARRSDAPVDWLAEAGALEDQILRAARRTPNGDVIWLHPRSYRDGNSQPVTLGPYLYNGTTGVALFLAAMESIEPRDGRRECILAALAPVRRQLQQQLTKGSATEEHHHLGSFIGLGGYLYGFALIGRWLGEPKLTAEAAELARLLTPEAIAADKALDVMSGCAGAALALLALDREAPGSLGGQKPVERAVACGEHLLARRVATSSGSRAWPCGGKLPACGFAHGAAGISYCLDRLFERTGEPRFRAAAEEGVAFERCHYGPERWNGLLDPPSELRFTSTWCNGITGVALGRLGMLAIAGGAPVHPEIRRALQATEGDARPMSDFLCCGHLGRAEVLLRAYEVLGDETWLQSAWDIAAQVVASRRDQEGLYEWLVPGGEGFAPSFFRGAAGVAYTFLRFAHPALLPCVLALEPEA